MQFNEFEWAPQRSVYKIKQQYYFKTPILKNIIKLLNNLYPTLST